MAIILCDIDGTLLVKIRADRGSEVSPKRAALNRALADVLGVAGVDFVQGMEHGLTDWQISERAVQRRAPRVRIDRSAWHEICARAAAVFAPPAAGSAPLYRRLPGVPQVLHALRDAGHVLGLVTGNVAFFARFKLTQAGIDRSLFAGPAGFGDDGRERADILRVAMGRAGFDGATTRGLPTTGGLEVGAGADVSFPSAILVLGDTVHDHAGARAVGLAFLGTGAMGLRPDEVGASPATGGRNEATSESIPGNRSAVRSQATWVPDLDDTDAVLRAVETLMKG